MKLLFLTILASLSMLSASAQKTDTTKANLQYNPNAQRNGYETYQSTSQIVGAGPYTMVNTMDHRYEGLRGTPYFLPAWNKGQIEMVAGQHYKEVPIKFDAYRQHLILLRTWAGNDSIIVNADQVKSFQLKNADGQFYVFRHIPTAKTNDESLKEGYFLVLYQGKSALLKRVSKYFKQADYKNPYASGERYDQFRDVNTYYVLKPDQTLTKVKLSDKAIIESLSDHADELKAYVKQESLSGKTENEAVLIVKKYDTL
ncbi:hypothetical protein GO730_15210 [Spirosoma sp. HMF3257]|uniref:Uncharacterized protein n=1 Tax=Spirosoma telluris TaxID=2183553 RepID=A0A327NR78_9BACT|nr:hypothetical protein [Spirosoma telluris]RAI75198.1 hypothetical protein HMF3257_15155 [Spirosoma telluris]